MKKFFLLSNLLFLFVSCNNDDDQQPEQTNNAIKGSWSLVSISGGFAPTINLNPSWIKYHFGQNLTVINNNPSTTAQNTGLETGSYAYSFNENSSICGTSDYYKVSISNFATNSCVKIEGNEMVFDFGTDADGLAYKFVREECGTPEPCETQSHAFVENATTPATGFINQPIVIPIAFTTNNSCGQFGYIAENNSGNTKTLKIFARYIGCSCLQSLNTINTNYNFTPTNSGNQIIKIEQPDGTFITNIISIQ